MPRPAEPATMSYAIRCQNLVKTYPGRPPVEAVRGLDLDIRTGECFGLLGPNGAGKATTMDILEGIIELTSGELHIHATRGVDHTMAYSTTRIGCSLQETRLADKLTVREVVRMFRSFYPNGLDPDEAVRRVSMEEKARSYVSKLSGGQRQRLAVACAIVSDPELLFLDEPTTGRDPQSRRQLWDIIKGFRDAGRTVMLTTHYMDEAERLCDRVAVVDHGRVIALGTPDELIARLGGQNVIDFTLTQAPNPPPAEEFKGLPSVTSARVESGAYGLTVAEPHVALPALLRHVQSINRELAALTTRHATLEDVFVNLTGRHLRDDAEDAPAK